ncbi:MAG: 4Fe-4S binding protein, partial [Candidatus Bathyarchaeia archaeon]
GYSREGLQRWLPWIKELKKEFPDFPLIVSITSADPELLAGVAEDVVAVGADGLQLDLSCPHHFALGTGTPSTDPELTRTYVSTVKKHVRCPLMQKLTYNVRDIVEIARVCQEAGGDAVCAIDTVRSLVGIDVNSGRPALPTFGGLSGPVIKPLALYSVACIAKNLTIPISGVGGIMNWRDAVEFIMAGASTVQIHTAIMLEGYRVVERIVKGISEFMTERGYSSPKEFTGLALKHTMPSVNDVPSEPPIVATVNASLCTKCWLCEESCYASGFDAISRGDSAVLIDAAKCDGCGLCVAVCPTNALTMTERTL